MEVSTTLALVAATCAVLLAAVYVHLERSFTYWRRRGVPQMRTTPFLGNAGFFKKGLTFTALTEAVAPFKGDGHVGVYVFSKPFLAVWDLEMVKQVLCKDFSSFHDRGLPHDEADPLSAHLFNLSGAKWRNLRNRLSPTFTSGKMKRMLPLMTGVAEELSSVLAAEASKTATGELDVLLFLHRFSTDVIGSCAFGMDCNCLRGENNQFLDMSRNLLRQSFGQLVRVLLNFISPRLTALVPMKFLYPEEHGFFLKLMRDTVKFREEHKVERSDFVELMMQLRDAGLDNDDPEHHVALTSDMMTAQAFIFFIAGLENVSNTLGYCMNRLAIDVDLQARARLEVDDVLRRHDGELSYEALKQMDLVNRVILEGLRLWNPIGFLFRKCNATTQVGSVLVDEGTPVFIPASLIHMDPDLYPDPSRFDPDRHTAEAQAARHPYAFLPFGEGPRICIASRFALMELRLALAVLLRDFQFAAGPKFEQDIVLDTSRPLPTPKNGIRIALTPRRSKDKSSNN